jgi:thymidylate synthase (FAD)
MKVNVKLVWKTQDSEKIILNIARISSENRDSEDTRLLGYLIRNKHWSPFEMANMCVEITGPRAILRQMLRHRSFNFQEFSQRYQKPDKDDLHESEARRQDDKNRQNSYDDLDDKIKDEWIQKQKEINEKVFEAYSWAIDNGIAKECARSVLPEGNTYSILCMNGTLRSWIHYLDLRCANGTQKEHIEIANMIRNIFTENFPTIAKAVFTKQ